MLPNSFSISHGQIVAPNGSPLTGEFHDGACPVSVYENLVFLKFIIIIIIWGSFHEGGNVTKR